MTKYALHTPTSWIARPFSAPPLLLSPLHRIACEPTAINRSIFAKQFRSKAINTITCECLCAWLIRKNSSVFLVKPWNKRRTYMHTTFYILLLFFRCIVDKLCYRITTAILVYVCLCTQFVCSWLFDSKLCVLVYSFWMCAKWEKKSVLNIWICEFEKQQKTDK